MYSSVVYRNAQDTVRLDVGRLLDDPNCFMTWDAYIFQRHPRRVPFSWCSEMGESYRLKRDLMRDLVERYGPLTPLGNISVVTLGW